MKLVDGEFGVDEKGEKGSRLGCREDREDCWLDEEDDEPSFGSSKERWFRCWRGGMR